MITQLSARASTKAAARSAASFASAYYYLPTCSEVPSRLTSSALPTMTSRHSFCRRFSDARGAGNPTILRMARATLTAFSLELLGAVKYLVGAAPGDDALMTGNHECCCRMAARRQQHEALWWWATIHAVHSSSCRSSIGTYATSGLEGDERGAAGTAMPCRKSSWVVSATMHGVRRKVTTAQEAPAESGQRNTRRCLASYLPRGCSAPIPTRR